MTIDVGIDFRQTSGYVTDPANCYPETLAATYPIANGGINTGYVSTYLINTRNRSLTVDSRLAGIHYHSSTGGTKYYVFDGLLGKNIDIRCAAGDAISANNVLFDLYDGDPTAGGAHLIQSNAQQTVSANHYMDATGVVRTSDTDWATNNAAVNRTFTHDKLYIVLYAPSAGNAVFTHARVTEVGGGGGTTATVSVTLGDLSVSISAQAVNESTLVLTLGDLTLDLTAEQFFESTVALTLGDMAVSIAAATTEEGTIAITLGDLGVDITAALAVNATVSLTLGDMAVDILAAQKVSATAWLIFWRRRRR